MSNNKSTYGVSNPEALAPLYLIRVAQDPNSPIVYPPAVPDYVPTEAPAGDVKDEVKKEEVKSEDVEMGAAPPQQQQQQQQPTSEMSQDGIVLPILPSELTEATIMFHTPKLFDVHIDITIPADVCTREANIIDTFIRTDVVNAVHKAVSGPKIEWRVLKEQSGSSVTIEVYTPDSGSQDTKAKYESEYIPFCEFNQNVELPDSFAN